MLRLRMFAISSPTNRQSLATSSQEIRHEPLPQGGRFVLPYRSLGDARHWAGIGIGFGIFVLLFMCGWVAVPVAGGIRDLMRQRIVAGMFQLAFASTALFGFGAGLYIIVASLAVIRNRTRTVVDVVPGAIVAREEFLFLSWKRRWESNQISKLEIESAAGNIDSTTEELKPLAWGLLARNESTVEGQEEKRFVVAFGYPREVLAELASELREALYVQSVADEAIRPESLARIRDNLERVEILETASDEPTQKPASRPESTTIEFHEHDTGIQFDMAPTGIVGPVSGFAAIWTLISCVFVVAAIRDAGQVADVPVLMSFGFVAIGVGMLLVAVNEGLRRTSIVTAGERLLLITESPVGRKRHTWTSSELSRICLGKTGSTQDEEPTPELQFFGHDGKHTGYLRERSKEEIEWIAWELTSTLQLADKECSGSFAPVVVPRDGAGRAVPGSESRIDYEYSGHELTIRVPSRGFKPLQQYLLTAFSLGCFGLAMSTASLWGNLLPGDGIDGVALYMLGLFGIPMIGGCIAMVVHCFELAYREYQFEIGADILTARRTGKWGTKSMSWKKEGLERVEIADSGTRVNGQALPQLVIVGEGDRFDAMIDHSFDDLSFVARAINEFMALRCGNPEVRAVAGN